MSTLYRIIVLIITFSSVVRSTNVDICSEGPIPDEVDVSGCTDQPCIFYIGSDTTMTMKFRSPRYLEHFAPRAVASLLGLNIDYPLNQEDGCVGVINTPCPLAEREYIEYSFSMSILSIFPADCSTRLQQVLQTSYSFNIEYLTCEIESTEVLTEVLNNSSTRVLPVRPRTKQHYRVF